MKTIIFLRFNSNVRLSLIIFISLSVGLFLLEACQSKSPLHEQEAYEDENIVNKIEKIHRFDEFIKSTENGVTSREEEYMTVSNAVWNIEALLNARHAHADKPFLTSNIRLDTIEVGLSHGQIAGSELSTAYQQAWQKLSDNFSSVSSTSKHVVLIDVKDLGDSPRSTRLLQITSFIGFGVKTGRPPSPCDGLSTNPFGETDFWWWGFDAGMCCAGAQSSDAAEKIEQALNNRYPLPVGHTYFTDIEEKWIIPDNYPNSDPLADALHFYLVFQRYNPTHPSWHQPTLCINPEDMNWYYCNWWTIIGQCKPAGKDFASVNILGDATSTFTTCLHRGWIYYGTSINCTVNEPCPPYPNCTTYLCSLYKKAATLCQL